MLSNVYGGRVQLVRYSFTHSLTLGAARRPAKPGPAPRGSPAGTAPVPPPPRQRHGHGRTCVCVCVSTCGAALGVCVCVGLMSCVSGSICLCSAHAMGHPPSPPPSRRTQHNPQDVRRPSHKDSAAARLASCAWWKGEEGRRGEWGGVGAWVSLQKRFSQRTPAGQPPRALEAVFNHRPPPLKSFSKGGRTTHPLRKATLPSLFDPPPFRRGAYPSNATSSLLKPPSMTPSKSDPPFKKQNDPFSRQQAYLCAFLSSPPPVDHSYGPKCVCGRAFDTQTTNKGLLEGRRRPPPSSHFAAL